MEIKLTKKPTGTMRDIQKPATKKWPILLKTESHDKIDQSDINPTAFAKPTKNKTSGHKKLFQNTALAISGLIILYAIFIGLFAKNALITAKEIKSEIPILKSAFSNLDTGNAVAGLEQIYAKAKKINRNAELSGFSVFSRIFQFFTPAIGEIPMLISNASNLSEKTLRITEDLDLLKNRGFDFFTSQKGNELIAIISRMEKNLQETSKLNTDLLAQSEQLKDKSDKLASFFNIFNKKYTPISAELYRAKDFLHSLLSMLNQSGEQHILLIFQNPSEIRPAGGFIGSFGEIIISQGGLKEIKIDDIYNADRQFNLKIAPPKELSNITSVWGARDANWFFDFPTSAKKVIEFLQESELYKSKNVEFQGAIAINTNILQSLLTITGPVELTDYKLTITPENFLKELQREVESGQDKKPGQNPKKILSKLAPILMEKLKSLDSKQKTNLIAQFKQHLDKKDIMLYFSDWQMQDFFESLNMAGNVLRLPEDFSGDYLAIVNANIAGGKTDAFIDQHISLKSSIDSNGKITNKLSVARKHNGENEKEWWYNAPNKDYLKALVPENSSLLSIKGNDQNIKIAGNNSKNLKTDLDLEAIEKTASAIDSFKAFLGKEFGKTSFGAWLTTPAGETKTIAIQYENGVQLNIRDGMRYEFIFEKQSGVEGSLEYSVTAPPGYIWKESGKPVFEYGTQQIKAREIITLTLLKS